MVRVFPCTLAAARTNSSEWRHQSPASPARLLGQSAVRAEPAL